MYIYIFKKVCLSSNRLNLENDKFSKTWRSLQMSIKMENKVLLKHRIND